MQNMISVEGFLREIYPLEYTLSENIDTTGIVAESFGDIRAKVQGAVKKLIEWIKKVIRMIREKVASIMSRLRKPPRIVGKNRPDRATEAWVAPSDLVVPDTIQDAVREALKRIEILTGSRPCIVCSYMTYRNSFQISPKILRQCLTSMSMIQIISHPMIDWPLKF